MKRLQYALFGAYIFLVLWVTLIDRKIGEARAMLTPFWEFSKIVNDEKVNFYFIRQILGNLFMFFPLGFMLPMIRKISVKQIFVSALCFSGFIELTQFITGRGLMEFDDVFNNTSGAVIGYYVWVLLRRIKIMKNDMPKAKLASKIYRDYIKRTIDIIIAIPVFIIALIPMILTAIAIKLDSPGPVLFKQERLGLHGKTFKMLKFRSMVVNAEHTGSGVYSGKGDARVTKVGKFIRATSIDELPQLINVLRGDMSLIGPRPPLTYHPWTVDKYTEEQFHMFDVRPGFSGWAQVHGRKEVEWHHRIELNVWYVQHVRFLLDVKIFFMTIYKVLKNEDNENTGETLKK